MGKLHKIRKAIEKNPKDFFRKSHVYRYDRAVGVTVENGKAVLSSKPHSHRLYVAKILRKLGFTDVR